MNPTLMFPCPRCEIAITSLDLRKHIHRPYDFDQVAFECSACALPIYGEATDLQIAMLVMDHQTAGLAMPTLAEVKPEEAQPVGPDPDEIGRLVQGMRIELDAIESLDDILLLWDYQDRVEPESVVVEAGMRVRQG